MAAIFILASPRSSIAYSVLTHEAIVDAAWEKTIQPLLQRKYPGITEEQLKEAHSYAYGGAIAPDMGYFPLGSRFFTNLVHYVRSGDFVNSLLDEAHDVNEYAFALGFLSHYMADKYGHFLGTNRCVPIVYPKMMKRYGSVVTYEEDQISHKRMEFAFDVLQTAKGNYASKAYHDFIGFNVSRSLLERAFMKTYGLDINALFKNFSFSIRIFRLSVKSLFPILTKAAWVTKKDEILKLEPTATSRSFRRKMSNANYYMESGQKQKQPGFFTHGLSWLIRVLPKTGPLKSLKFKEPGLEAEKLFIQSFDTVLMNYTSSMIALSATNINFVNIDFDTGYTTVPGEYELADVSYGALVIKLSKKRSDHLNDGLKQNIIEFYSNPEAAAAAKNEKIEWKRITRALKRLNISQGPR
ncbi:MAG: zinc dependent phospholipase C family protein [Chitinophagaceae bacterium]